MKNPKLMPPSPPARASQPQPKVEAGAALCKAKSESISSAAVEKLWEAADEQAKKNDARRQQLPQT